MLIRSMPVVTLQKAFLYDLPRNLSNVSLLKYACIDTQGRAS
jgi:hypothetical protein